MSHDYIPFANTDRDCKILLKSFAHAEIVRTTGDNLAKVSNKVGDRTVWADAGVDGLEQWLTMNDSYRKYAASWVNPDRVADTDFQTKPDSDKTKEFTSSVLEHLCADQTPGWISVPQLPAIKGSGRNKINRIMAKAAGTWQQQHKLKTRLILPFVITHNSQIKLKQDRNKKVDLICSCLEESGADALWVVDRSLNDQDGASSVKEYRLKSVIDLHEEIRERTSDQLKVIAGPYWGLNLILWSRGIVQHPAIGLGNGFQYYSPGGFFQTPKSRIAIGALKRLAVATPSLQSWLKDSLDKISKSDPAYAELSSILSTFQHLQLEGRDQVAAIYARWLERLHQIPLSGRALALYQELSSAYVFGRALPKMPQEEGSARRPERVAEQLMMHCL
jgi:hypothetical protein